MEPWHRVTPELVGVLDELAALEPLFHRYGPDATGDDVEATMAPEFWEIGASGRRYNRELVGRTVEERLQNPVDDPWSCSEFALRKLAPDVFLLTYVLEQGARRTLRTTIWQRHGAEWRAVFHQGTIAASCS